MSIGLIDTGCANLASVRFALERAGLTYRVIDTPARMAGCDRFILPGVGAAGPAMRRLRTAGWDQALATDTRPLLGICLGMQMLFERSAEGEVACLGLIPGAIEKLPPPADGVWPHMGWNALEILDPDEPLLAGIETGEHVYFVHGFYAPPGPVTAAVCDYGRPVSALVRHRHIAGCQFHPERSGAAGARILANFAMSSR
ncbi:imidazole glycerol phosphate synthase subunit HisH [Maricaulis maris]|uniref:Imidazole glycerol phosphate synthase subunit HisH n=1 Tax=Maricaulis maris TaxID=74318 RepID=A0A495DK40_9PROT|nr:imidazole glycerol phosphate synthase subunit HisH [Maricaulis maris]RKR02969.1 imidazole glycerol phosphate synthase subunit HisH [Maricaulis maris]